MSLEDDYTQAERGGESEWDGSEGYIKTGTVDDSFNPTDVSEILKKFGFDPDKVEIVGDPRISRWEQFSAKPGSRGSRWLSAYRFQIRTKTLHVDLPALYAEVARGKKTEWIKHPTGEATVVVCWSDIQTGKVDYLGGIKELLHRLDEKRGALEGYLQGNLFNHIVITDCGDIIEGFSNFDAQTRTNSLSLMDQVDVAATELWKTIKLCVRYAPTVDVLSIPSNHCRWGRGKSLIGKTTDDWGLHVSKRLEQMGIETGLPATFYRAEEWQETLQFDIRSIRLGLAHGHQVSNPDKITTWWAKMTHGGVLNCDVLVTGHFHFPSLRPSGKTPTGISKWHIQASTLDNGSSWVRNKFGEDGDPALTVFQINNYGFDVTSFTLL